MLKFGSLTRAFNFAFIGLFNPSPLRPHHLPYWILIFQSYLRDAIENGTEPVCLTFDSQYANLVNKLVYSKIEDICRMILKVSRWRAQTLCILIMQELRIQPFLNCWANKTVSATRIRPLHFLGYFFPTKSCQVCSALRENESWMRLGWGGFLNFINRENSEGGWELRGFFKPGWVVWTCSSALLVVKVLIWKWKVEIQRPIYPLSR